MPHIVVEYSDNIEKDIEGSRITEKLHAAVVNSGFFSPEAVKARAVGYSNYVLPEGAEDFVHITTSILTGRTEEQRKALNDAIFSTAKEAMPEVQKLSSNIHEMDKDIYRK
jgi:5-carboxymethyl-2-hydroxymuconate isomerase